MEPLTALASKKLMVLIDDVEDAAAPAVSVVKDDLDQMQAFLKPIVPVFNDIFEKVVARVLPNMKSKIDDCALQTKTMTKLTKDKLCISA